MDNGTEYQRAWRTKVAALLAYERGPYEEAFGVPFLTIAVVTPDATRRDTLAALDRRRDCGRVGQGSRRISSASACLPPDWDDVTGFFLGDAWRRLGNDTPVPLIEGIALPPA